MKATKSHLVIAAQLVKTAKDGDKEASVNYAEGIKVYDKIEEQALKMADVMAKGIVKQFPQNITR